MPDSLMTTAVREAYASAPSGIVLYHCLTLTHAAWSGSLNVVQDIEQHTLTDETSATRTYLPVPFAFSMPEVSESSHSEIRVELDTVPRDVTALLDQAAAAAGVISLTYRAWLSSDASAPAYGPLSLVVLEASATLDKISLRASAADIANKAFPNLDYTPSKFPGLVV
jgi:hypothetical protein